MNNLYRKVAVASVCTALGLALGASEEASAATFTLPPTINFEVIDYPVWSWDEDTPYFHYQFDGVGDSVRMEDYSFFGSIREAEGRLFAEFNIDSFSFVPNEDINRVLLQTQYWGWSLASNPPGFGLFGYVGNGTGDLSDFGAGVLLSSVEGSSLSRGDLLSFDVTGFVKQRVSNGDSFAGFGFRGDYGLVSLGGDSFPGFPLRMVVETADVAEPVPEPTTIFGSAIGLGLGGWLKRKKSSQQNKTTSQG
ncbi:PEP-CTERM sorting domain-containing protein [Microcoleus sp. herbarium2]|uniref:PEP-CTERM sorting domain-containing protein n=1 Tax=Microcoleus sp. herbarium2 TaxID=3055433 RepID=UPI002FD43838